MIATTMATMDKLMKALEALKATQPTSSEDVTLPKKKESSANVKDKILHCSTIADAICSPSLRSTADFPKVLGLSMDTFIWCCDDENSDVRLMADECLNRTIKTLIDSHLGRLLVELFKEIKKDGPARSLRAALSRFGDICHLMRPQKCRPYTVNLVPTLAKICQRKEEEAVQETLAIVITKIMPVLGQFTNDKDIKMLLKAFLPNLAVNSAIVRRAAATSLTCICQHSRRPSSFYSWLLSALFELILPVQEERPIYVTLGILLCLRHLVPHLGDAMSLQNYKGNVSIIQNEEEMWVTKEQILKVYEITLHFAHHPDHNVITATLETLYQLLKYAPKVFQLALVSSTGITKSLIYVSDMPRLSRAMSESQSSVLQSSSIDESALEDEHDIYIVKKKAEDSVSSQDYSQSSFGYINESTGSIDGDTEDSSEQSSLKFYQNFEENYFNTKLTGGDATSTPKRIPVLKKGASDENFLDTDDEFWDQTSIAPSPGPTLKIEFKIGNIGTFTDLDVPLKYCVRLLCSSFLLSGNPGSCIPDRNVRISVKSLALGCLSSIFSLYPCGFFLPLHVIDSAAGEITSDEQKVWDVILYGTHSDPHIRGQAAVLIGNFLGHALREAGGCWSKWLLSFNITGFPTMEKLIAILISVVQDDSSVASKHGLVGLKQCLNMLLNSQDAMDSLSLLETLLKVKDNAYWLSKVELTEVISSISFKVVYYLESKRKVDCSLSKNICYQDRILNDVLIPLLGDEDFRVRQASAVALVKLVPKLYFPIDHLNKDPITTIAKENIDIYLDITHKGSLQSTLPLVHALVKPFSVQYSFLFNPIVDASLSRVINLLVTTLRMCSNKHLIYGCCHALCLLSEKFLVTVYPDTWNALFSDLKHDNVLSGVLPQNVQSCQNQSSEGNPSCTSLLMSDILCHLVSLITNTSLCLDLIAHQHALQLAGNLLCGAWYKLLLENHKNNNDSQQESKADPYVFPLVEVLFQHLMRLLNIFTHILEEQYPVPVNNRPALPSLSNAPSLSPIKRKSKPKEEATPAGTSSAKGSPNRSIDKNDLEKERVGNKIPGSVGQFHTLSLYMKLFDILKGAHGSYKISMDFQSSEKFCLLLKCALNVMSQMLEVSETLDMSKNAEEILYYLKSLMVMEPCSSVQCVRQLLKCLFGTNLITLSQEAQLVVGISKKYSNSTKISCPVPGLYHTVISYPYADFTHSLADKVNKGVSSDGSEELLSFRSLNWVKRGCDKLNNLLKSGSKGEKANLAAHIRLFEGVVIRALQQYTISSDVSLQCQVLDLLAQLVQLRVNYCLLDADQIFIGYVIKQFDFIEEGQIPNADILIPRIFYFLILLSYERYHSKPIISVPKILQLCDGLIASGQPPDKYVVRALQPVIEDLFLIRSMNKMDIGKELDAQREVIVSTLFKLVCYPQVLDLFFLIIGHSRQEGEDKWRKTSRQIVDVILPLLSRQQIQIETQAQLNLLHKLLESVASNVFRPVDILLKALFSQPKDLNVSSNIHRWMCMVLTVLRVLISQANEEAVLSRLSDMGINVKIYKLGLPSFMCEKEQSITDNSELTPGSIFSRFLFQVIGVVVESLCNYIYSPTMNFSDDTFLCQLTSHLLLYLTHMFQSGTFRQVTTSAMSIIKEDEKNTEQSLKYAIYYTVSEIESLFIKLAPFYPTLVIQWCNILTLLNYDNKLFWSKIVLPCQETVETTPSPLSMQSHVQKDMFLPCNLEMVRRGGILLLCDYVCENSTDVIQMTWLIVNHVNDIIDLSLETTVQDFISTIHRNAVASGLWMQAIINAHKEDLSRPMFWKKALHCLEKIHLSQSGKLLSLLVDNFLATHHLIVANICDQLACRRLENLLSEPSANQLCIQDVDNLLNSIKSSGIERRHKNFILLCEKLKNILSDEASPSSAHPLLESSVQIQDIELNKEWYIKFVKERCFAPLSAEECAHLLGQLKYEDILAIMCSKEFQPSILGQCLRLGTHLISSAEKYSTTKSDDPFMGVTESPGNALYRAAQSILLQHLTDFMTLLPRTSKHQNHLHKIFAEESFGELLFFLAPATCCYLKTLDYLPGKSIPNESLEDIALLSIVCCEAAVWIIQSGKGISLDILKTVLVMLDKTLKIPELSAVIGTQCHISWIHSAISSIHLIVNYLQQGQSYPNIVLPFSFKNIDSMSSDQCFALKSCAKIVELVSWLENFKTCQQDISEHIIMPLKGVIRDLARLPVVNSFARSPPILWQLGWSPEFSGQYKTSVPPPPGEFLQDRDVLKQYIYRINLLGWISRQQFEETWMALLGVLSATPIDNIDGKEEDQERIRTSCLAVKSITSLLLQTLLLPEPGNPQNSTFLIQPRDKPLAFQHTKCGKKLMCVRLPIHAALQKLLHFDNKVEEHILNINAERVAAPYPYSLSQVSLEYLSTAAGLIEENEDLDGSVSSNSSPVSATVGGIASFQQRDQCLSSVGLDIHSCLHFLLDLYSQWLSPQSCPFTPLTLLTEVTKSVVALSDIFMEKAQFEWMLDTFLEVQRIHPAEDEIIAQYLIFGICKSAAVLGIEQDVLDRLRKLIELSLKSSYLPTRTSTLYGLLYLLEHGGGDESFPLLPTATDYIVKNLDISYLLKPTVQNEDHILIMWALAFYIIENYQDEISEEDFSQKVYQLSLNVCGQNEYVSNTVFLTVLHGLERLLVAEILSGKEANLLLKLTVDRIRTGTPIISLAALGLFLSCMYIGKSTNMWSNELVLDVSKTLDSSLSRRQIDSEFLLVAMERVTTLFDRIKKAYPFEADVICGILPPFLMEFFPVQEILNKIITEFLSSQQPHPQLMAKVIFEVFQYLHKQSQQEIIHEWVLLSLSNFMQRSPLSMAIWSLSCFFISATTNYWFQALFLHVQNRMGKMEEQDKILFCIAGVNFRNELQSEEQKQAFLNTIQSIALPQTPYADLLRCL